jgi:hypothetical protein
MRNKNKTKNIKNNPNNNKIEPNNSKNKLIFISILVAFIVIIIGIYNMIDTIPFNKQSPQVAKRLKFLNDKGIMADEKAEDRAREFAKLNNPSLAPPNKRDHYQMCQSNSKYISSNYYFMHKII